MSSSLSVPIRDKENLLIPFLSALFITLFLFFIDEGYYDFRWMKEWSNWVVFVIYLALLFPVQWLVARYLLYPFTGLSKAIMMLIVGIPLTLFLFYLIVM